MAEPLNDNLLRAVRDPERLRTLQRVALLDTPSEEPFDRMTRLAARLLEAPIALVSLVDADRQFFKSCVGLPEPLSDERQTPLSHSFCQYVVATAQPLVIADARDHPLVRNNPAIADLGVIAYAGVPLITHDGHTLGSFCVVDTRPHTWTPEQLDILTDLTALAMAEIERRTAEQESEAARQRLRAFLDTAPVSVLTCTPEGTPDYANGEAERIWEPLRREAGSEGAGRPRLLDTAGEPLAMERTGLARVLRGEEGPFREDLIVERPDGSRIWIQADAARVCDPSGNLLGGLVIGIDITGRVQAERRGRVQHAVSRVLVEAAGLEEAAPRLLRAIGENFGWEIGALWEVDPVENALRCRRIWHKPDLDAVEFDIACRELRLRRGVGLPGRVWAGGEPVWISNVSRDDNLRGDNFPRGRMAEGAGLHGALAFPIRGHSGVLGVVEFFCRAIRRPDEPLLRVAATLGNQVGQFIERKRAEQALRSSEARKTAILETALDAFVTMDQDGRVIEWNPAAERMFGYRRDEALGREMAALIIPPALQGAHRAGLARYLATGEAALIGRRIEVTGRRADGEEFLVELTITRIPTDGPPILFTGTLRDITERRRTEEALTAAHERARHVAESLERSLLLKVPEDEFPGLSVATIYEAAWDESLVGGDFFDAFSFGEGKVALVVGDATGKGLSAGIRTAEIKFVLRAFLRESPDPAEAFARLNDFLYDAQRVSYHDPESFIILSLAVMDPATGRTAFAVAGAEAPLVLRADGSGEMVEAGGLPLGLLPRQVYAAATTTLSVGDALLLATDGITEARRGRREFLGVEGMLRLATEAAAGSARQIGQAVLTGARAFAGGTLHDDVCILVARRR